MTLGMGCWVELDEVEGRVGTAMRQGHSECEGMRIGFDRVLWVRYVSRK